MWVSDRTEIECRCGNGLSLAAPLRVVIQLWDAMFGPHPTDASLGTRF
jgi:hypothetical protein